MAQKNSKAVIYIFFVAAILIGIVTWKEAFSPAPPAAEHGHAEEGHKDEHGHGDEHTEGGIRLTPQQISSAGIKVVPAGSGTIAKEINVPGKIVTAADRMAEVVPKIGGTVTEVLKNLGDRVVAGDVLARIESREMAESVAEYLAAKRSEELARGTFNREKTLWEKKITAEQEYLNARNAHQEAKIRYDLSRQKLQALGHSDDSIRTLEGTGNVDKLRFLELKSPVAGRVIQRNLTLGSYIEAAHKAFEIADLSVVWVDIGIPPADLASVQEGQAVAVSNEGQHQQGKLIFVNPAIDAELRAAKAIVELDNSEGRWTPGSFVNAAIATSATEAEILLPKEAIQTVGGNEVVFVRNEQGFEPRPIKKGREDSQHVEILSGVEFSEPVAITNTFAIKAELGKSEAEHEH